VDFYLQIDEIWQLIKHMCTIHWIIGAGILFDYMKYIFFSFLNTLKQKFCYSLLNPVVKTNKQTNKQNP